MYVKREKNNLVTNVGGVCMFNFFQFEFVCVKGFVHAGGGIQKKRDEFGFLLFTCCARVECMRKFYFK